MSEGSNPRFGKYELVAKLGMGGMAEVFKARYARNPDVVVAIKRILPEAAKDRKLVSMMITEARLSMGLSHPNIVPFLDFGTVEGTYYLAMEYVQGKDLKSLMIRCRMRKTSVPVHMAVHIAASVLRGLDYAHNKTDNFGQPLDMVHRDMSPHNVMISLWGEVKILDFGIAKASSVASSTQLGVLKGKFSYMSPEQARGGVLDRRSDVFSAGIVLWEMLTLESYYSAESDLHLLALVREGKPRDPRTVNPAVSEDLAKIVLKALQPKARKRYPTAEAFALALETYQSEKFGSVSDDDLAAFLRNLFGITAKDLAVFKRPERVESSDIVPGGLEQALNAIAGSGEMPSVSGVHRPKRRSLTAPAWLWKAPLLLAASISLGLLLHHVPPRTLLETADGKVVELAAFVHTLFATTADRQAPYTVIEPLRVHSPAFTLSYDTAAEAALEEMDFDRMESVRRKVFDLAFAPRPADSTRTDATPETRFVRVDGIEITYEINNHPPGILIRKIDPARRD